MAMNSRCARVFLVLVSSLVLSVPASGGRDSRGAEEVPLGVQLDGLDAEAKIAYLRYLIGSGDRGGEVYFQLALAFHESGSPDSARHYYSKAIESDPGMAKAHVNLGVLYDGLGETSRALGEFQLALSIDPNDILALSHAAFMQFMIGRHDKADEYITRALEVDPRSSQAHFYLAIFFWESGMFREAFEEWQQVVELAPESSLADKARENIALMQNVLKGAADRPPARE